MSGTLYLILIQVFSRALTFAGNQVLLRYISPQTLGIATQLEIYSVLVLYFSRESLRVALQRQPLTSSHNSSARQSQTQVFVNISYVAILVGLPLSIGLGLFFRSSADTMVLDSPYFETCLKTYGLATVLELLSEPAFVVLQQHIDFKARAKVESLGALLRCITACCIALALNRYGQPIAVLPFAVGQIAYSITLLLGYTTFARKIASDASCSLWLRSIEAERDELLLDRFSRRMLGLSTSLYIQSGFKQLLSQADALILAVISSLEDQGAFALAANYGGLAARLFFQPIEESSRISFGRLLQQNSSKTSPKGSQHALNLLMEILRGYGVLAIFTWCFAPSLLPVAVRILVGKQWYSPMMQSLLANYCLYIPFMAINGITEAFVSSVASAEELRQQTAWMVSFSGGFGIAAYLCLRVAEMGASGLVWANIANMSLRIIWSTWFINRYAKRNTLSIHLTDLTPSPWSVLVGSTGAVTLQRLLQSKSMLYELTILACVCGAGGLAM